jgi:hypothetical protein
MLATVSARCAGVTTAYKAACQALSRRRSAARHDVLKKEGAFAYDIVDSAYNIPSNPEALLAMRISLVIIRLL